MILYKVFNEIFSTYSSIAVLRELQYSKNGLTGREIARLAGISPPSALKALVKMTDLNLVNMQIGGRDHIYKLNFENVLVKEGILSVLKSERNLKGNIANIIKKKMSAYCTSVILYGSVARKEEIIDSDYDICVVYSKGQSELKLHKIISDLHTELFNYAGISLSTYYIKEDDFRKKVRLNKPPVADIRKEGIVLFGKTIRELSYDPKGNLQKHRKESIQEL